MPGGGEAEHSSSSSSDISGARSGALFALPPPTSLDIHDSNAAEKWKEFEQAWRNYSVAMKLHQEPETVQIATLLTVIGAEARKVFSTFTFGEGDPDRIQPVLESFAAYCQPLKNVPFERYRFYSRMQEAGESYDHYRTVLRQLADRCEFETITADQILRDKLVFGSQDSKVRERLLREKNLSLQKTDEICRAHETSIEQMKVVGGASTGDTDAGDVNAFSKKPEGGKKWRGRFPRGSDSRGKACGFCGRTHDVSKRENCPAFGKRCNKCNKQNHFANVCFGSVLKTSQRGNRVHYLEDEFSDEFFGVEEISAVTLDDSQLVTLKLESGNYLRFQPDTGAQCNVVPLHLYKKATRDFNLLNVTPESTAIISYGGTSIPILGRVRLRVWRGDFRCFLDCNLVDSKRVRPILGRKACLGMKIIKYLDNDQLNHPQTSDGDVYAHDASIEPDQLVKKFHRVFSDGVGKLPGEYHMMLDETVKPVQHPPRRVPVAIQERLRETLEDLERREIVARVTTPTSWISSMVVVPKPNGTLRICLDPKDLNRALQRENYPLPTIEEVATRLHGAKVFTVLDVACGFWHVALDEQSSFLTTFNTPFGRYRWKRMPFGIKSAPEIFQRKMHELIEGLNGVEVIADDFVVVGYGDSLQAASKDHDKSLSVFLQRCEERGVHLNIDKLKLRMREVPFIGHVATSEGLRADPAKVRAIHEMP